jgi:predicted nucleotidyltransferase
LPTLAGSSFWQSRCHFYHKNGNRDAERARGGFDLKRRSARRVRLGSRRFELAIRRIPEGGPQALRAGRFGSIQNTLYSMLCKKQLLRPRFSMQLDAQSADDLENRVWRYTDRRMRGMIETQGQDPLLGKIVQRLVDACQPERIYLFGSRARGDGGADSDYDIMVVVAQSDEPAYRRAQRAHSLLWDLGAAADILVWTRDAFDSRVHLRASLPATIAREGRLLYVA